MRAAAKAGMQYKQLSREDSITIAADIEKLRYNAKQQLLPDGGLARPLNRREEQFINSERLICKMDFKYFFVRYFTLELDPGVGSGSSGNAPPTLLESQQRYIDLFGRREEQCYEELQKYKFTEGILAYIHKVRQVAATATIRAMTLHRMIFWPGTRAFAASLDDDRKGELFKRDHLALDNLPFWLKPTIYPDVKDTEIGFEPPISSRISYQAENQQSGVGVGSQNDVSHLTEVALWKNPNSIRYSFLPSVPKSITTLHVQESTSDGKGNYWHEVSEAARRKDRGYESWIYAFIPWYYNKQKYRMNVPDDWRPSEHTQRHAELIERTSPEFLDGKTYHPSRQQLMWWETSRMQHMSTGELAQFLTNYPATPEQSFQTRNEGALPAELLEIMEQETMHGMAYDIDLAVHDAA